MTHIIVSERDSFIIEELSLKESDIVQKEKEVGKLGAEYLIAYNTSDCPEYVEGVYKRIEKSRDALSKLKEDQETRNSNIDYYILQWKYCREKE